MVTKEVQTVGWLCLQLMTKPDPDKMYRLLHHSGKCPPSPGRPNTDIWEGPQIPHPHTHIQKIRRSKGAQTDSNITSLLLWWHMFVQKNLFLTIFIFGLWKLLLDERIHLFQHHNLIRERKKEKKAFCQWGILNTIWAFKWSAVVWGRETFYEC